MYMLSDEEVAYSNSLYSGETGTEAKDSSEEQSQGYERNQLDSFDQMGGARGKMHTYNRWRKRVHHSESNSEDQSGEGQSECHSECHSEGQSEGQSEYQEEESEYGRKDQHMYEVEYENSYQPKDQSSPQNESELFKYVCIASIEDTEILFKCSFLPNDLEAAANYTIKKILGASKRKLNHCNKKILNWDNKIIYFTICTEKKMAFFLIGLHMKGYFKNYAFEFLKKLEIYTKSDLFSGKNYKAKNINPSKIHSTQAFLQRTIKGINKCCRDEKIIAVKQKLHKINSVMNNHIDNLYQSRGNIKALKYKTQDMSKNTLHFVQNSKKLKRIMLMKYWKTYVLLACFAIIGFKVYRSI
ncbi:SNARE protein, putative [Plasmodium knowlesi strain H]|uniref:SNARE protein, putative n=3 Tax=Plasmodium knowlesi TaxID=5850 RepID=A0A5K1VSJ2_PLAKH|nr:SNARE protein, putative [Plasmodium knowlesi strain H]OTN68161.1 putative SNARE protein [Plasmodium knowlesi]CAA9990246.1 SNARE protein, putative [Plasmodium knowlesi strain H]SBO26807.1 SNARE protein, putative [Plasmodium knowlesi strain H]SBO28432.1 SNARE protein, putative [Plasmodium knowlesi strain H]VVS79720.1 SNARE protein, putative [Plasmodium knowlesi strain H]|eukprot:XP_002258055.1 hypothetical protein, conserved in Plasmodium species [Plasmodium knowlesi strain H]